MRIHPRRWLDGFLSYPRYLGYIRPQLMTASAEEYIVRRKILARGWEPRRLALPVGKRILALSAHSDDESIGAGGLLWAHREIAEIHLITLCDGGKGGALEHPLADPQTNRSQLLAARKAELSKTAKMLNVRSCHYLEFPDERIPYTIESANRLRALVGQIAPDVVLLPWFLDEHIDHRGTNVLYAWGCADLELTVLAYEIWSMLEPNAVLEISPHLEGKLTLIQNYASQLSTVDYLNYASGLAKVRAYQYPVNPQRTGAVEAYLALPNREYCALVQQLYGEPGRINESVYPLLGVAAEASSV